ncbi:MAG: sensor histidine kinase [Mycobacteriales bacterium]
MTSMMDVSPWRRIGITTAAGRRAVHLSDDEVEQVDQILLVVWALLRGELLLQALITVAGGNAYRNGAVAGTVLAVATGESVLITVGAWRRFGMQTWHAWVDTAVGCGGIVVLALDCPASGRVGMPLLWMLPFIQGSAVALALCRTARRRTVAGTALLIGAYLLSQTPALTHHAAAGVLINGVSVATFYLFAALITPVLRALAATSRLQRLTSLQHERERATLRERATQFRKMHDSVLQTLEALAAGHANDHSHARQLAAHEAVQLRALLADSDQSPMPATLLTQLEHLSAEFPTLSVEVVDLTGTAEVPAWPATLDAVRELLNNVIKHAHTHQVTVSLSNIPATRPDDQDSVELVVRDHGTGFTPGARAAGYGLAQSVTARITELGGTVDIWSQPGQGTRVTLITPRR